MIPGWTNVLGAAAALAVVLGLVWLAQFAARRGGRVPALARGPARLALVQTLALDQRRRIQLVRCDTRHLLILTGGGQDVMLGFVPAETQT